MTAIVALKKAEGQLSIPIEYEAAVTALTACVTLDEAKFWDSKIDLLIMWANVHKSTAAETAAKRLKLYSYRRLGELAKEMRPKRNKKGVKGGVPGAASLLIENGLSRAHANAALLIAKIPTERFNVLLERPVAPTTAATTLLLSGDPVWRHFIHYMVTLRAFLVRHPPAELVGLSERLGERQEETLRAYVRDIMCSLRQFQPLIDVRPTASGIPREGMQARKKRARISA